MDPLVIISRSHDLVLHARVLDYSPDHLDALMYKDRRFFDYGGHLDIYPIEDLPYWRVHMRHRRESPRFKDWADAHPTVLADVRRRVETDGPLGPRDFEGGPRVTSYRGSKEAGVALYLLWLVGDLMTHSRRGSERVYDLAERIAPPELLQTASDEDAGRYFSLKWLHSAGLTPAAAAASLVGFGLRVGTAVSGMQTMQRLVAEGLATPVRVEGVKDQYLVPTAELPILHTLAAGKLPRAWKPLDTTTEAEVTFLSPLDNLLDRRRAKAIFDFEYIWEIYKKPELRAYGSYTLPVLYGDRLVARLDLALQRKTGALAIRGLWLEHAPLEKDRAFERALLTGLTRLAAFVGATQIEYAPISSPKPSAAALTSRIVKSFKGIPSAR
jgi:hypothetical protein